MFGVAALMTSTAGAQVRDALAKQTIEVPSWAFGNSGTRFKVFSQPGVPRDPEENSADAAQAHAYTRDALAKQTIEVPSWAFGNSGTRFKVFSQPGVPRDPKEKIADAAQVHAYTGAAPRVSLHIPWDLVDDFDDLAAYARDLGVQIGMINSNVFQDDDYKLGSLTNADPAIRKQAIDNHLHCIEVLKAAGSTDLKLWLPDGPNDPR